MAKPTPPQEPKDQAHEPRRLGGFELLGRLGKGGMGTVLKARQVSMDRLVALKILPKKLAEDERFVQRFLREARSAAKLRHPNIVQAFDVGQSEGYYFFAMEFVDGETLDAAVRREGPLEPNRALDVMKQVTSALAAAHEAGIVHRDIKPSNIMIDKKGEVRVTDFGLAKRTEGDVAVTADGAVVGTPAYVAPEMAKGGEADGRSDLYSLGATIFCVLAGRPPFEGRNFSEVLIKQVNETAPPLATLAPRVDRRLCHIIDRLLRKNPEARYPSANALLDDLNGLGKLQSVAAAARAEGRAMIAEAPTLEMTEGKRRERQVRAEAQRPKSNRTTLIAVGAIVAILAVVGIVLATRRPKDTTTTPPVSVPQPPTPNTQLPTPTAKTPVDTVDNVDAKRKAAELAEKERIAKAKEEALAKTRQQGEELLRQADAAIAAKDFAKARSAIKSAQALGIAEIADEAKKKLAEIASREKSAAEWAKWDAVKADAKKLIDAGKFDEAAKLLDGAKALPLDGIADLLAEQMESIESTKSTIRKAALAAYQAESDKLWALFKERKYPEADKLLLDLPKVPNLREAMAADLEAAKLLKAFWAAVEKGVATRKGTISIEGALGNVTGAENGVITLQTAKGPVTRTTYQLTAKQALAYAAVVLKDDERSHLAEALFRIAEAEDPTLADKALAAAGNPPGLPFYKGRLAALTLGATELAARKAWAEIEAAAKPKPTKAEAQRLIALLDAFETAHGKTKHFAAVRDKLADLRAQAQPGPKQAEWVSLFDGKTLTGWRIAKGGHFQGEDIDKRVTVADGCIVIAPHNTNTGLACTRTIPKVDYELAFECLCIQGSGNVVFPVGDATSLWEVRGRGGMAIGAEPLDPGTPKPAFRPFQTEDGRWFRCRLSVEKARIKAWADDEQVLDLPTAGYRFGMWAGNDPAKPLGFFTVYDGSVKLRNIRIRKIQPGAAEAPKAGEWQSLFDGKTLKGWESMEEGIFAGHGPIRVSDGLLVLEGVPNKPNAIHWTEKFPTTDYEVEIEAKSGPWGYNFCDVAFPVGSETCQVIVGGTVEGKSAVALGNVDGREAATNGTLRRKPLLTPEQWFRVRIRVTGASVEVWIDDGRVIDQPREGHTFGPCNYWAAVKPFSIATWTTAGNLRKVRMRRLDKDATEGAQAPKAGEWQGLFDGKTVEGWQKFEAAGQGTGTLDAKSGHIVLGAGNPHAGIIWTQDFPKSDYELELKVSSLEGYNQPCVLSFPVQNSFCTLFYNGGTGAGLSKIGGKDFGVPGGKPGAEKQWYALRLRVTKAKIEVWVDRRQVLDVAIPEGAEITCDKADWKINRLNIRTWKTTAAYRDLRFRRLGADAGAEAPKAGEWQALFDGKTLDGWQVLDGDSFKDRGKVHVQDGVLRMELGPGARPITGIVCKGKVPTDNYEVEMEAMRTGGNLDFANLTFPVGEEICSLIVGGHINGDLIGLRNVDGQDPWQHAGHKWVKFQRDTWYRVRLRVAPDALTVWVDDEQQFAMPRAGHRLESFWVLAEAKPFGVVTYITGGAIRSLRVRRLAPQAAEAPKPGEWQSLFDGKTLDGWKVAEHDDLKRGEAKVEDGAIVLAASRRLGLCWTGDVPQKEYEVTFETSLVSGHRLASLYFPVGGGYCDLVLGGISGGLVGLDGVDGRGYRDNAALARMKFEGNHWYTVRVVVGGGKIEVWADGAQLIALPIEGHTFGVTDTREALKPLGLAAYQTTTAVRNIRLRRLGGE